MVDYQIKNFSGAYVLQSYHHGQKDTPNKFSGKDKKSNLIILMKRKLSKHPTDGEKSWNSLISNQKVRISIIFNH